MTAILGEHDVTVHEGVEKNCRISKTVQHPGYKGQTKHDMMLAQIKCNVCFSLLSAEIIPKWGASSLWPFGPNSAWRSVETMTIGKPHSTLKYVPSLSSLLKLRPYNIDEPF